MAKGGITIILWQPCNFIFLQPTTPLVHTVRTIFFFYPECLIIRNHKNEADIACLDPYFLLWKMRPRNGIIFFWLLGWAVNRANIFTITLEVSWQTWHTSRRFLRARVIFKLSSETSRPRNVTNSCNVNGRTRVYLSRSQHWRNKNRAFSPCLRSWTWQQHTGKSCRVGITSLEWLRWTLALPKAFSHSHCIGQITLAFRTNILNVLKNSFWANKNNAEPDHNTHPRVFGVTVMDTVSVKNHQQFSLRCSNNISVLYRYFECVKI